MLNPAYKKVPPPGKLTQVQLIICGASQHSFLGEDDVQMIIKMDKLPNFGRIQLKINPSKMCIFAKYVIKLVTLLLRFEISQAIYLF